MSIKRFVNRFIFYFVKFMIRIYSIFFVRKGMVYFQKLLSNSGMVVNGKIRYIGFNVVFDDFNLISLGDNIVISDGSHFLTHDYSITVGLRYSGIKIDTDYKKDVLTKNSSGVITDYNLSVISVFSINLENKNKTFKFEENINIKNQTDTFEQNTYEKDIKRNFASTIREKLFSAILSINDN